MAKRSIIKKLSKEQKSLLIGLLLGDGTISSNCVFKLSHSEAQREYLEWKVGLLDVHGIKNNGVKDSYMAVLMWTHLSSVALYNIQLR